MKKKVIVIYEVQKDFYGEGRDDEFYRGEFTNSREVVNWLGKQTTKQTTKQNINRAIKKGYLILDRFLVFRYDLEKDFEVTDN